MISILKLLFTFRIKIQINIIMRKILLFIVLFISLNASQVFAQNYVVNTPQHKNVVLEEYTGIHCGYCPDGHVRAELINTDFPNRVVLINIHAGSFATPQAGEPDFRTIYGEALANEMGVSGYPSGTVNRHIFPDIGTIPAMSRSAWYYASTQIFPQLSPLNVGYQSSFDVNTRQLTVDVEMFYTEEITTNCFLQVALLENHVYGYQSDYTNGTQTNYDHKHIMRDLLTGQWGFEFTPGAAGTYATQTFTSTVDSTWDINNCDLAVYVTEGHFEVYTGVLSTAVNGNHDGSTSLYIGTITPPSSLTSLGDNGIASSFTFDFASAIAGNEDFELSLSSDNAPADWSANYSIGSSVYTGSTTQTINNLSPETISINVTPGASAAYAKYTLEMKSVTYPTADIRYIDVYVMSGVTDLIVTGSGSWGDGGTYAFDQDFVDGLDYAANTSYAEISASLLPGSDAAGVLDVVTNLYCNIGWKFPSILEEEALALMNYLDNGGNLFISGQDIGWDIMSGDGYGGPNAQLFFTSYLNAGYSADGSSANSQLNAVATDPIFGNVISSGISDIFSGNMYPDQLTPLNGSEAIFTYNTASKVGGLKFDNGTYKIVYLGIDLAMIDEVSVRKEILKLSHDWFYGLLDESEVGMNNSVSIYPNPTKGELNIDLHDAKGLSTVEVMDLSGRTIKSIDADRSFNLDLSSFDNGIYLIRVSNGNKTFTERIELLK
jgi:hypothetical protein